MVAASTRRPIGLPGLVAIALTAGLAGCVDQMPDAQVGRGDVRNAIARGQLTSPRAATVALVSLSGAPADMEVQFRQSLAAEAATREIAMTDEASARYLVRGYLSAYPGEQGVRVAYTYDVFDAGDKQRRQRVSDAIDVPGDGDNPWTAVNVAVMASLTSHSADDLAVSLSETPEAQATASAAAATLSSPVPPLN